MEDLWGSNYIVLVNDQPVVFMESMSAGNTYIHFAYEHSTKEVKIVPEFPSALIYPLLIIFTLVAVALSKRKQLSIKAT